MGLPALAVIVVVLLSTSSISNSTPTELGVHDHAAATPAAAGAAAASDAGAAAASAAALQRLFSQLDANADGELEATELQAFAGSSFTSAEEGWGSTAAVSSHPPPTCIALVWSAPAGGTPHPHTTMRSFVPRCCRRSTRCTSWTGGTPMRP